MDINTRNAAASTATPIIDRVVPRARRIDADLSLMSAVPAVGANLYPNGQICFAGVGATFADVKNISTPAWAPPPRQVPL